MLGFYSSGFLDEIIKEEEEEMKNNSQPAHGKGGRQDSSGNWLILNAESR